MSKSERTGSLARWIVFPTCKSASFLLVERWAWVASNAYRVLHHVMCLPARVSAKEQTSRDGKRKAPRPFALPLTCTNQDLTPSLLAGQAPGQLHGRGIGHHAGWLVQPPSPTRGHQLSFTYEPRKGVLDTDKRRKPKPVHQSGVGPLSTPTHGLGANSPPARLRPFIEFQPKEGGSDA